MTNRQRLLRAANDLQRIKGDLAVSTTPYEHLTEAVEAMLSASRHPLDSEERELDCATAGFSS